MVNILKQQSWRQKNPTYKKYAIKSYIKVHHWLKDNYGKAIMCEICHNCNRPSHYYEWAKLKNKRYACKRTNFKMMCRRCHIRYDWSQTRLKNISIGVIKGMKNVPYTTLAYWKGKKMSKQARKNMSIAQIQRWNKK